MKISITLIIWSISIIGYTQEATQEATKSVTQGVTQENAEKTLIDFTQYEATNSGEGSPYPAELSEGWEQDLQDYPITQSEMALDEWVVRFNSSSSSFHNIQASQVKKITTKTGETVLGAHIHFPYHRHTAHARIKPYYEIIEYNKEGALTNIGNGVVANVQTIRSISAVVGGRNYNHKLSIRLMDQNRNIKQFFLGYLNFAGFRKLTWSNKYYLTDVRNRRLFLSPLYPKESPYYKFESFVVSRMENGHRGDFVIYFKNVTMEYDLYENISQDFEIQDEDSWGIKKFHALRKTSYLKKLHGERKVLRDFEQKRIGISAEKAGEQTANKSE